eukprot:g28740.t1
MKGVAMGTGMGPSYACLFIGYMEQSLFRCYTDTIPHLFLRYIEDCIGAALCSHEELEQFINFTNNFHPNLKFTWTFSNTSLSFLDLFVSISGDRLETDGYFKPTNSHSYLDYTSSHPSSCKNAIAYSQFLHLHHVCSQDGAFHSQTSQMSSYFKDHNFPLGLGDHFMEHLHSVRDIRQHLPVTNHFNNPSNSLGDMFILGLLQCHNDTTRKQEEQHLIFRLRSL